MSGFDRAAIAAALRSKVADLVAAKAKNRVASAAIADSDRQIDRDLADARAAARFFNISIEFPDDELHADVEIIRRADGSIVRRKISPTGRLISQVTLGPTGIATEEVSAPEPSLGVPPPTRPPVKEIVLDQLKQAGGKGLKAAKIKEYIERVYGDDLHPKTVGMTLFRLSQDGLVRRDRHTWFLVETRNAGVAAPASNSPVDRKEDA